jgi:hypothetical protein
VSKNFYSYSPHGEGSFVIEGEDGSLLIGDQLPSTEKEARLLTRCANIAYRHGEKRMKDAITAQLDKVLAGA